MNSMKKMTVFVLAVFCLLGLTSEFYAAPCSAGGIS